MFVVFSIFTFFTFTMMLVSGFRFASPRMLGRSFSMVAVGDMAPDFELKSYNGKTFKLSTYRGKKPVVVFFYPADNTPGCTTEVCAFEQNGPDFKKAGAEVFGISSGGAADKEKFVRANKLTAMELLADSGDKVRNEWKVPRAMFGAFPGRVTYVVGKDGRVKYMFDDLVNAAMHPVKALAGLAIK